MPTPIKFMDVWSLYRIAKSRFSYKSILLTPIFECGIDLFTFDVKIRKQSFVPNYESHMTENKERNVQALMFHTQLDELGGFLTLWRVAPIPGRNISSIHKLSLTWELPEMSSLYWHYNANTFEIYLFSKCEKIKKLTQWQYTLLGSHTKL